MNPFNINSLTDEEIDDIEDSFDKLSRNQGGGKSTHKGPKTAKRIREIQRENAEKSRLTEVENNLKKELQHFPFNEFNEETVENYSDWVCKSLNDNYPYFTDLDGDIKYTQSRSSGPGGQNVNKTSTAVMAKHMLTGIFSRSEDSREAVSNKRDVLAKLLVKLEGHIKNWNIYLKNISTDSRQEEITSFMENLYNEKVKKSD
jgi:hypothetical protein